MTRIKFNILQVFMIVFCLSIGLASCNTDEQSKEVASIDVENFNTLENRQAITNLINDKRQQEVVFNELQSNFNNSNTLSRTDSNIVVTEENLAEYMECSDCGGEYKDFLQPMFQEFLTIEDGNVLNRLDFYESQIDLYSNDETIKANLEFLIFSLKASTEDTMANRNSSFVNRDPSLGTSIGQGMVGGFVAGCINGAYVGGTVGTVTVPVIGTVVGAVSGCFAAGAVGAVIGSGFGAFWNWVNN